MNANQRIEERGIGYTVLDILEDERRAERAALSHHQLTEKLAQEHALRIDLENRLGEALACLESAQNLGGYGVSQETLVDAAVRILASYDPEASA